MVALATLVFIPAASSAQLVPTDVESPLRNDASYRDGPVWVSVQREAAAPTANTRVTLRAAERVFHAEIDRRAILQLAPSTSAERLFARSNLQLIQRLSRSIELYLVEGKHGEDGVDVAARLSYEAQVIAAIPDLYIPRRKSAIAIPPNDPRYGGQWYLKKLDIERAWRLSMGDPDTIVVVIDDGCDLHHP